MNTDAAFDTNEQFAASRSNIASIVLSADEIAYRRWDLISTTAGAYLIHTLYIYSMSIVNELSPKLVFMHRHNEHAF